MMGRIRKLGGFLLRGADPVGDETGAQKAMPENSPDNYPDRIYRVGDLIGGDYRVLKVLEGGMGTVYIVRRGEAPPVVLKAPKGQSNPMVRENFRTEAETWVRISGHINIVSALMVLKLSGQIFVCAELVRPDKLGRLSLRDHLISGPLESYTIADWAVMICYGLEYACSKGLVAHRDIKPENILIDRGLTLRITDFGISRAVLDQSGSAQADHNKLGVWKTVGGNICGTPPYMAPEQWLGAKQDVRTDLYAFGIILYEMCYGRRPFTGPNYSQQHLVLEPEVPDGLFAPIIARCLAKKPMERYGSPRELLEDLSRVCAANNLTLPEEEEPMESDLFLYSRAYSLLTLKKSDEALTYAEELVDLKLDNYSHWNLLGAVLLAKEQHGEALNAFNRSLSLDKMQASTWKYLGTAYLRIGSETMANDAFERAEACEEILRLKRHLESASEDFVTWYRLGAKYISLQDRANALSALERGRALAPAGGWTRLIDRNIAVAKSLPTLAT
jgi:serine/threonine protein kinase